MSPALYRRLIRRLMPDGAGHPAVRQAGVASQLRVRGGFIPDLIAAGFDA